MKKDKIKVDRNYNNSSFIGISSEEYDDYMKAISTW